MTAGASVDPKSVLKTVFHERCDEMVVVRNIHYTSLCEHHLLPFVGEMTVGYLPDKVVVGLSKIPRLVEVFARRLSMQERLTNQVAHTLFDALQPRGVAVVARANHSCMGCRGVNQATADMVTSAMLGMFRDPTPRAEFLALSGIGSLR
jgi:GTP cyclohydrolase I